MELNIALPYDPVIPLLDIYPEKTIIQKDYLKESDQVSIYWVPHRESGNSLVSGRHLPHPTEEEIDSERGRDSPKVTQLGSEEQTPPAWLPHSCSFHSPP